MEGVGCGQTLYLSSLIEALHEIPEVVSIGIPLTKLALFGETGATNIVSLLDQYPHLAEADCVITCTEL